MKKGIIVGIVAVVVVYGVVYVHQAQASSLKELVQIFLEQGIIPPQNADRAWSIANLFDASKDESEVGNGRDGSLNAEHITIGVSQYIQHADRTYAEGEAVEGLHMLITNTADEPMEAEGRRQCVVSYSISTPDDELLFDSAAVKPGCTGGERIAYILPPNGVRMIEITHTSEDYHLTPGVYIFKLNYPEYGSGELEVTIK